MSVIYGALLFYDLKDPIVPIVADPIPVAGYGDDLTAIVTALKVISVFITTETKIKSRQKTMEWFSNATEEDFNKVDSKIELHKRGEGNMRKVFILIALIMSLMITGCTTSKTTTKEEETIKSVYCDSCSEESKEATKFCSNCGVEAKWVAEKSVKVAEEMSEENKVQCLHCSKYFPKSEIIKFEADEICKDCNALEKTCENGFDNMCQGCTQCEEDEYNKQYEANKESSKNFTAEQAMAIAEKKYGFDPDIGYGYDTEPLDTEYGKAWKVVLRSKSMIESGGTGTLLWVTVYSDGIVLED